MENSVEVNTKPPEGAQVSLSTNRPVRLRRSTDRAVQGHHHLDAGVRPPSSRLELKIVADA